MAPADALCMHCGLCCDGTFFGSVVVAADEQERLGRVGLRVVESDGGLVMPQRCSALQGHLCSAYEDRPRACVRYTCTLRSSVLSGTTSGDDARASVARMQALLATIRGAFALPEDASIWQAIAALEEPEHFDPMSAAGRKIDAGVAAVSELRTLARATFESALAITSDDASRGKR